MLTCGHSISEGAISGGDGANNPVNWHSEDWVFDTRALPDLTAQRWLQGLYTAEDVMQALGTWEEHLRKVGADLTVGHINNLHRLMDGDIDIPASELYVLLDAGLIFVFFGKFHLSNFGVQVLNTVEIAQG